jgi:hypothetical protein
MRGRARMYVGVCEYVCACVCEGVCVWVGVCVRLRVCTWGGGVGCPPLCPDTISAGEQKTAPRGKGTLWLVTCERLSRGDM